jgi:AraC family transcriptional activator of tynA and feaB
MTNNDGMACKAFTDIGKVHETLEEVFLPMSMSALDSQFQTSAKFWQMGTLRIASVSTTPMRAIRGKHEISFLETDYCKVLFQIAGTSMIEQGGNSAIVSAGEFSVYDAARPYSLTSGKNSRFISLILPIGHAVEWRQLLENSRPVALPTQGLAHLILQSVLYLSTGAVGTDPHSAHGVQASITALLLGELRQHAQAVRRRDSGHRCVLLDAAERYVVQNIADSELTVGSLAQSLHVSRRTLFNAFSGTGQTPYGTILDARIETFVRMLEDPAQRNRSITEMAIEAGFSEASQINRHFKKRFGATPTAYREFYHSATSFTRTTSR